MNSIVTIVGLREGERHTHILREIERTMMMMIMMTMTIKIDDNHMEMVIHKDEERS